MKVLIAGATGATGSRLVEQLLHRGHEVKAIVRSPERLPSVAKGHVKLEVITASLLALSDVELAKYVKGCEAVVSCLGHNVSFKGIYGQPQKLVTNAVRKLCRAIKVNQPEKPVKFILMNTVGNRNRDLQERISLLERIIDGILRLLLPPHKDNIAAVEYLRKLISQGDPVIEWVTVRPDTLIENDEVTAYEIHPSPIRSAIFNPGKTSRINVADFMAGLITDEQLWNRWKGQMPVIYNRA